ncbi:M23 family metallopeptidase [Longivirga aurantiaca]|uniref:M23 family metallopeptidase n=1 Tax=Longivirga aurantiaca TaxID=1837743 RepID=A0ABW1T1Z3_9ACTN
MILLEPAVAPLASLLASALTALTSALGPLPAAGPPTLLPLTAQSRPSAPDTPTATDTPAVAVGAPGWQPPLRGPLLVTAPFDPPLSDWMSGHRGVDLLAFAGDAVRAPGDGVVVFAGPVAGRDVVTLLHLDGRTTTYEPVAPEVGVGESVAGGQVIGRVHEGAGHCGEVPSCLHWGLRDGEDYLDPMSLLRRGRPSLLPWNP